MATAAGARCPRDRTIRSAQYEFRLGWPSYLIHGTNKPYGVGMRSSHGCMRLYPEDIAVFFDLIPIGTKVTVVNQPYLFGWRDGTLYMQAYAVMEDDSRNWNKNRKRLLANLLNPKQRRRRSHEHDKDIDWQRVGDLAHSPRAVPVPVTGSQRRRRCGASPKVAAGREHPAGGLQLGRQVRSAGGRKDLQRLVSGTCRSAAGSASPASFLAPLKARACRVSILAALALHARGLQLRRVGRRLGADRTGVDYHSFANVDQFRVTHLELDLRVDFQHKTFRGSVDAGIQAAGSARDAVGARHQGSDDPST